MKYKLKNKDFFRFLSALVFCSALPATVVLADDLDQLIKQCGMCHGADGNSPSSTIPSIAGLTLEYFKHTMDAYKNDGRKSELMKSFVHSLNAHQIEEIGTYFQQQTFKPRDQKFDPEKVPGEKPCMTNIAKNAMKTRGESPKTIMALWPDNGCPT